MNIVLPAEVLPYSFGGWGLAFWVGGFGAAEDDELEANAVLCRSAVAELVRLLARHAPVDLSLPPAQPTEIVVETPLKWKEVTYGLSYNTMDGAVSVEHAEREPLDSLLSAIDDVLHVAANDLS